MTKMRGFWFTICFVFALFLFFSSASTDSAKIIINEIGAYEESGYEWIEIFNRSEEGVDLTGWRFWEGGVNHGLSLKQGQVVLAPGAFGLIVQDDVKFKQKYPMVTSTIFDSSWGSLSEDGEEIGIKFGSGGTDFVEKFVYIAASNFSLERKDPKLDEYLENNWVEHESGNTAGGVNSISNEELPEENDDEENQEEEPTETNEEENAEEQNQQPLAEFTVSSSSVFLGTLISFDASSSSDYGGIEKYLWNFGDGATDERKIVDHIYNTTGTFQVELLVEDDEGSIASSTKGITVMDMIETEEVATTTAKILINEFVSDPNEGKEWIELLNVGSSTVSLTGFTLSDGAGVIASPTSTITSESFLVIELASNKLNNGGDIIILKNGRGEIIDSVTYGDWEDGNLEDNTVAPIKGNSMARINNIDTNNDKVDFAQTTSISKGTVNIITSPVVPTSRSNSSRTNSERSISVNEKAPIVSNTSTNFASGIVIINELFPNPKGSDTDTEFIELYNTSSSSVSLVGWKLVDKTNKSYTIQEKTIEPFSYAVFLSKVTRIALNNSGEESLTLLDPSGKSIYTVVYTATSTEELSYSRKNKNDWEWSTTLTIGKTNIFTAPQEGGEDLDEEENEKIETENIVASNNNQDLTRIFFSEIFPAPVKSTLKEFVEIGNDGDTVIDLGGFFLDDIDGGSKPYKIPKNTKVEPQSYIVFSQEQTKLILNNTEDSVRLLDKNQDEILVVSYEQSKSNESYIIDENNDFLWTTTLTPGEQNVLTFELNDEESEKKLRKKTTSLDVLIEDIRDLPKGEKVKTRGMVAVLPGILGSQYFYIVDESSGMQIYNSKKDFPELKIGDLLEVTGEVTVAYGETRVKTNTRADMVVIGQEGEIIPEEVEIIAIDKTLEGALVKVQGEVTEVKTNFIYIDDGTSEIKVVFKAASGIQKENFVLGKTVSIKGIVSVAQGGYQISPRSQKDIEEIVLSQEEIHTSEGIREKNMPSNQDNQKKSSFLDDLLIFLLVIGFLGVILFIKRQFLSDFIQRIMKFWKKD